MLQQNISLKPFNTFSIDVRTEYFAQVTNPYQLRDLLTWPKWLKMPKLILGGGSNVLIIQDFPGIVIQNSIKGIRTIAEDDDHVWLSIGAGENWHQFVCHCINHQYAGVENLSLIPGTVGAAPIQNIGAYGIELQEIFSELKAINLNDGLCYSFKNEDCQFGYRDSIFKQKLKGQFLITEVILRLNKKPKFCLQYAGLQNMLEKMEIKEPSLKSVSDAVCKIRQHKLPDPQKIANAGSFFKNPIITEDEFILLQKNYPKIPHHTAENHHFKIPAAWLIEQCGWKGYRCGEIGVYDHHALVLVNYGQGKGSDIKELATKICRSIHEKFSIYLEPEVNIIPHSESLI